MHAPIPRHCLRVLVSLVFLSCTFSQRGLAQSSNLLSVPITLAQLPAETTEAGGKENAAAGPASDAPPLRERLPEKIKSSGRWSVAFGVAIIADTRVDDYVTSGFKEYHGAGSGLTYNLTTTYRLREFDWKLGKSRMRPVLELPFMLTLVDEDTGGNDPFLDYNLGLSFRWRDFPWNRHLYTTFAVGGGFSYSSKIWTADQMRHEGEDRSNLKFWLPIEFTLALPRHPQHQLMLFIDHQSGGWTLDTGGIDAWGAGYRIQF